MAAPGVHAIEGAGLKAWPTLETGHDGSRVLRAAALAVVGDNLAAHRLYENLGYAHVYDYHYRVPS